MEEYLTGTEGIWDERSERVRAVHRALARLDAPDLTIFLLVVELGSKAEVSRRLGVHRSTVGRIYARIERRIRDELERR